MAGEIVIRVRPALPEFLIIAIYLTAIAQIVYIKKIKIFLCLGTNISNLVQQSSSVIFLELRGLLIGLHSAYLNGMCVFFCCFYGELDME